MNVFTYIKQNYDCFTDREKLIADYLIKNRTKSILDMSAKEIANLTFTSAPTVVRFAKKLGFNSLNEMKLSVSMSLNKENEKKKFNYLKDNLTVNNIVYGIKDSYNNIVNETISLIKQDDLDKVINMFNNAKNIYIFSVGSSGLVGMDFYYKLIRINKNCIAHRDTHLQLTSSALMGEGDVAFAISYSGGTKEVLSCVKNAKENNCKVISLTKASIDNKLNMMSDITLKVPSVERSLREGAIISRISQLSIIDMIFLGMARSDIKNIEEKLIKTRKAILEFEEN